MASPEPSLWMEQEALSRKLEEARRELESTRAELDHARRLAMLGTMAGSIAHEFNNLLTPVLSYAELALGRPGDETLTQKALERAAAGADRASRIATAILNFVERSPQRRGASASADVAECVEQAFLCLAHTPSREGIEVVVEVPKDLRLRIEPIALQHILMNLILNSRRAMREVVGYRRLVIAGGEGSRVCSTWNMPEPRPREGMLLIADTGAGMPEHILANLGRPFPRGGDGGCGDGGGGGTGLGLSICRQLLAAAEGRMSIQSRKGEGTCIALYLPRELSSQQAA